MTAIGQLRIERGLTQQQLADAVGSSFSSVRNWETGRHKPSDAVFPKLAAVLKCRVEDIGGGGRTPVYAPLPKATRTEEEIKAQEAQEATNREKAAPYKKRRIALGFTQKELAEKAGVNRDTVMAFETGKHCPGWGTRQKLQHALGMDGVVEERHYSVEERNQIFLEMHEKNLIHWLIQRNIVPLQAIHADLDELYQDLSVCILRAIDRYTIGGPASVKTFVINNADHFIKKWIYKTCMHGLAGTISFPLPNISVISLDYLREEGFDLA